MRFKSLIVTTSVNLALAAGAALSGAAYMNEPRPYGIDPSRIKTDPNINKSTGLTENEYKILNENAARAGKRLRTPEEREKSQEQAKKLRADALKVQAEKAGRDYYEPGQGFVSRLVREVRHAVTGRLLEPNVLEAAPAEKSKLQYWENPGSPGRPHFGAAIGLMSFVFASLASLRITGRTLGGLMYPQSPKQKTAHDHFDEQFKAHQALTKWPHAEENQKAAAQADFNGQAAQSVDAAPSVAQPAASSEAKNIDVLRAQASLKDKGMPRGPS